MGLDPRQIVEIRNVIKELGKRRTIILSTHILSEVEQICERVLVIDKGIIIADDTPEDLAAHVSGKPSWLYVLQAATKHHTDPTLYRRHKTSYTACKQREGCIRFPSGVASQNRCKKTNVQCLT